MLSLGGILFEGFELPEKIAQGGNQELVIQKTIGGRRVIDSMGPDDAPIEWSGRFLGETAQLRALRLDLLRRSGREVELAFGLRAYRVVVRSFQAQIERPYLVPYSISCEIIEDLVAGDGGQESRTIEAEIELDLVEAEIAAQQRLILMAVIETVRGLISGRITAGNLVKSIGMVAIAEIQGAATEAIATATGSAFTADLIVSSVSSAGMAAASGASGAAVGQAAAQGAVGAATTAALSAPIGFAGVTPGGNPEIMSTNLERVTEASETSYASHRVANHMTRLRTTVENIPPP